MEEVLSDEFIKDFWKEIEEKLKKNASKYLEKQLRKSPWRKQSQNLEVDDMVNLL